MAGEVYICGMSAEAEVPDNPEEIVGNPASIEMLKRVAGNVSTHLSYGGGAKVRQSKLVSCHVPTMVYQ